MTKHFALTLGRGRSSSRARITFCDLCVMANTYEYSANTNWFWCGELRRERARARASKRPKWNWIYELSWSSIEVKLHTRPLCAHNDLNYNKNGIIVLIFFILFGKVDCLFSSPVCCCLYFSISCESGRVLAAPIQSDDDRHVARWFRLLVCCNKKQIEKIAVLWFCIWSLLWFAPIAKCSTIPTFMVIAINVRVLSKATTDFRFESIRWQNRHTFESLVVVVVVVVASSLLHSVHVVVASIHAPHLIWSDAMRFTRLYFVVSALACSRSLLKRTKTVFLTHKLPQTILARPQPI